MTKEEIYTKVCMEWDDGVYPGMAADQMHKAMDEYAKQEAIAFVEWVEWYKLFNEEDADTPPSELYNIYLQSKINNNETANLRRVDEK